VLVAVLSAAYVVAFLDRGLVATVGPSLQYDLHLSDTQFGLLSGPAFVVLFCLCSIPLGWLADRTSRQAVIAIGMVVWSLMTAACALTSTFAGFFVARLGVGLGEACLVPAALSLIRSASSPGGLAKAVAVFLIGATIGNAIALIGGGEILRQVEAVLGALPGTRGAVPWRALFTLASVPGIVLAFVVMRLRVPPRVASRASLPSALRHAGCMLQSHRGAYLWLTASTTCIIVLSQAPTAWMPLWYARHYGIPAAQSAMLVGVLFVISAPTGQWLGGTLIDRMRARGVAAAPHRIQAVCALLCVPLAWGFCSASSPSGSAACYALFNLFAFGATPAGMTGWQWITPPTEQGLVLALLVAAVTLAGIGLGPSVVGLLSDHLGSLGRGLLVTLVTAAVVGTSCALRGGSAFNKALEQGLQPAWMEPPASPQRVR
jgi:MFS family permease